MENTLHPPCQREIADMGDPQGRPDGLTSHKRGLATLESPFFILQVLFVAPACGISREVNQIDCHCVG